MCPSMATSEILAVFSDRLVAADGSVPVSNEGNDTNEAYSLAATDEPEGPPLGNGEEERTREPLSAKEQVFKGLSSVQILYLQTPISGALLLIPSAVSLYLRVGHIAQLSDAGFLAKTFFIILLGGCLAINLDIFNLLAVKYTSAISLTIAGVARTSFIILASWLFFRNEITKTNFLGFAICLVGVVLYNIVKYQKLKREIAQDAYKASNPPAPDQVLTTSTSDV
uniref:Sugar phosphate transporter domain-containing protein n=1 Tax=Rhodosorus marinus TaxID=101924 RepID=A0A7S0G3F4_9RHOD|mmetsp:Transcript_21812/g.31640  ORF Transcript_21812/g.31640 Transcript_21812/m.31640 type:complete len:225 (+) Transcript_21812:68-742(+)